MELTGANVVHADGRIGPATLRIESGMIVEVDDTVPARGGVLEGLTLLPGFVDLHCHGGGGGDYSSADAASIEAAIGFHRRHGTTTSLASLVSAPIDQLQQQTEVLRPFVESGELVGVHLEGPWLASGACGAQDARTFTAPDVDQVREVITWGDGVVAMVTIAPELPSALDAVVSLRGAGIIVAVGHTHATHDQTHAAIDAGATVATHLFNAMPPMHHRAPGPVGALLADPRVSVEIICDTVHVHPDVVRLTLAAAGDRAALITDAISAAGTTEGMVMLGEQNVNVQEGVARVVESGALAGSLLTMRDALAHAVFDCGIDLATASRAASLAPARALGLFDRGEIAHSMRADLVAVDDQLQVYRVMRAGAWLD